jgi:hypothetical protein
VAMIKRSVVIIREKEPFLQWLKSLPDPANASKEIINQDIIAYLLPELSYGFEEEELPNQFHNMIFEEQLNGWWTGKNDRPKKRNVEIWKKWFDVELNFYSIVLDLVDTPLQDD